MNTFKVVACAVILIASVGLVHSEEMYISEYAEGADFKRAAQDLVIELYNPTAFPIDLDVEGYVLQIFADGALTPTYEVYLHGIVAPLSTYVIVNAGTFHEDLINAADLLDPMLIFDGNDAIVLVRGLQGRQITEYLDVIGQVGIAPPSGCWCAPIPTCTCADLLSTMNGVLRRTSSFLGGIVVPTDPFTLDPAQWTGFVAESYGGLGLPGTVPVELQSLTVE